MNYSNLSSLIKQPLEIPRASEAAAATFCQVLFFFVILFSTLNVRNVGLENALNVRAGPGINFPSLEGHFFMKCNLNFETCSEVGGWWVFDEMEID